jgi:hypothetical protein
MKNTLTLVGIDGLGIGIDFYINIFELCHKEQRFEKTILFTAAEGYHADIPEGLQIEFVHIPKMSYKQFNAFCLINVAEFINTTHALFVQTDGFICNGSNWKDDYFEYDYIGQPWINREGVNFPWVKSERQSVGEGGFSLRSKKLLDLVSNIDHNIIYSSIEHGCQEDVFICSYIRDYLEQQECLFATPEIGTQFCAGLYQFSYDKLDSSFGFHANEYVEEVLKRFKHKYNLDYLNNIINYKK